VRSWKTPFWRTQIGALEIGNTATRGWPDNQKEKVRLSPELPKKIKVTLGIESRSINPRVK
jgi:hypothetical protein